MRRSRIPPEQRGSASLLFAVVVLPFLIILLVVGIEAAHFFCAREEILERLDFEVLASLRAGGDGARAAAQVRDRLNSLRPYVMVDDVRVTRQGGSSGGIVRARYKGPLLEIAANLVGSAAVDIPMEVTSSARRPHGAAFLLLDRTVLEGADPCADSTLLARAEAVQALGERLRSEGIESILVGVTPGTRGEIAIIGEEDGVERCSGSDGSIFDLRTIQGTPQSEIPDSLALASRIVEVVTSQTGEPAPETRSVMMFAPRLARTDAYMTDAFALLESEAARERVSLRVIGLSVAEPDSVDSFSVASASGLGAYLNVSVGELQGASLRTALLHHVQGRSVIAR